MFLQISRTCDVTFDPGEVSSLAILIAVASRIRLAAFPGFEKYIHMHADM